MKQIIASLVMSALIVLATPFTASAAKAPSSGSKTPESIGYDVSYPQCGKRLPADAVFTVVGVNGGKATTDNPCFADQLVWAIKASGQLASQPKVQLYVNTANPGEVISQITTWPTSNTDGSGTVVTDPYGTCNGGNNRACSWQYGWNRAQEDVANRLVPGASKAGLSTAASSYTWWLDVETMNTWQSGSAEALARNAAALEGMTSYFTQAGGHVGLYSTADQWNTIIGSSVSSSSPLNGLGNWRPSGASLDNAKTNCTVSPLTSGGFIALTQYVQQNLDKNHSCI